MPLRHIISILLQNEAGALTRVAGLFSARGYNIDSLTVAATLDPAISRLTLVTTGDEAVIDQIIKQSRKLIDVLDIVDLTARGHLEAELVLVRVVLEPIHDASLRALLDRWPQAQIRAIDEHSRTLQFGGTGTEVDTFLSDLAAATHVLEIARSGPAAL